MIYSEMGPNIMSKMVHIPLAPSGIRGQLNYNVTSDTINVPERRLAK